MTWFRDAARRFMRASGGGVTMMFTLATPGLLLAAGMAFDFASVSMLRTQLQAATDAAAIAGAREFSLSGAKLSVIDSVVSAFVREQTDPRYGAISHTVAIDAERSEVKLEVSQVWQPVFGQYFVKDISPVVIKSTARLVDSMSKVCVLSLGKQEANQLFVQKSARVEAKDCGIFANSVNAAAIRIAQMAEVSAGLICSAGGISADRVQSVKPEPVSDCPPIDDPLKGRPAPATAGCDHNNRVIDTGVVNLDPGVYCGGLRITGDARVNFTEGEYIIKDGPLNIDGTSMTRGDHAGFYLTGIHSVIDFGGAATIDMVGPRAGTMAGLLFHEDADAPGIRQHRIKAANAHRLEGTIYLPIGTLLIDPDASVAADSAYTAIVVRSLVLDEGPTLVLNADYKATEVPVPEGIGGGKTVVLAD